MLLLRHASAGERLSSPSIDQFRQLDTSGRAEARQLIWSLADREIERVMTSPLARCVETVIPIAESRRLVVEYRNALLPEAHPDAVLELLEDLPDATLVCTHREVMLHLFEGDMRCEKGGAWVFERAGSLFIPTEYLPPPSSVIQEAYPRTALSR